MVNTQSNTERVPRVAVCGGGDPPSLRARDKPRQGCRRPTCRVRLLAARADVRWETPSPRPAAAQLHSREAQIRGFLGALGSNASCQVHMRIKGQSLEARSEFGARHGNSPAPLRDRNVYSGDFHVLWEAGPSLTGGGSQVSL